METIINGTSICVIEKWIAIIEKHINAKSLYVKIASPYLAEFSFCNETGETQHKKLLFLQKDVAFLIVMLSKVFPDLFQSFSDGKSLTYFVIKRDTITKNAFARSIANKVSVARYIIALSK